MLLCFEALMNIPGVVKGPHSRIIWSLCVREFSFSWGALSLAAMYTQQWRTKGTHWLIYIARIVLGIALIFFAVQYFLHPELLPGVPLEQLTPNFIPAHSLWGYLTGVIYISAGVCLFINKTVRPASTWVGLFVLFTVIFFCLPSMLQHASNEGPGLKFPADTLMLSEGFVSLGESHREKFSA